MKAICLIFALFINHDGTVRQEVYEKDFGLGYDAAVLCEQWKHQREFLPPVTSALAEHYVCIQEGET